MAKKIGILTYHGADNLGAVLQSYALQTALTNLGALVEIVDYRCSAIENTKYVKPGRSIKAMAKALPMSVYYAIKRWSFSKFRRQYLHLSKKASTRDTISRNISNYSTLVVGSDQVWNPACSGNDDAYFLDFAPKYQKRISYAASIGSYRYSEEEKQKISGYLSNFEKISVREKDTADMLKEIGIDAEVHPDPVILLPQEQWLSIMPKRLYDKPYVLVYLVLPDQNVLRTAREYADKRGYKVISNKHSVEFILHNSPAEFLSWVFFSEGVFTNSFHGSAFSCIFNKPLCAEGKTADGTVNNRIWNLLSQVNAERCVLKRGQPEVYTPDANDKLAIMRKDGIDYLEKVCEK